MMTMTMVMSMRTCIISISISIISIMTVNIATTTTAVCKGRDLPGSLMMIAAMRGYIGHGRILFGLVIIIVVVIIVLLRLGKNRPAVAI